MSTTKILIFKCKILKRVLQKTLVHIQIKKLQMILHPPLIPHIQQEFKNVWSAIHSLFTNNIQTASDIVSLVKHEREINHRLNEELRLLCSKNSPLQAKCNTLSEKIKELESTIRDL